MATILDYLNRRGAFVLWSRPWVEHAVWCETPDGSFKHSVLPRSAQQKTWKVTRLFREALHAYTVPPEVNSQLSFLPTMNQQDFRSAFQTASRRWANLVFQVRDNWSAWLQEAHTEVADQLHVRWRSSDFYRQMTEVEYGARALRSFRSVTKPVLHDVSFTFLALQEIAGKPDQPGYIDLPAMLWRWLDSVSVEIERAVLDWFTYLKNKLGVCKNTQPGWWYNAVRHRSLLPTLDARRFLAALDVCGRTKALDVLRMNITDLDVYNARYKGERAVATGRKAAIRLLGNMVRRRKMFEEAMQEHVDLQRLIEAG